MSKRTSAAEAFLQPVTPHDDPVDGELVLCAIRDFVSRFMVLPRHAAETVALWVLFAHAHDAAEHSPILAIESPEKRCGKTTLLNIIAKLVPSPLPAANITTAAIFRSIEKFRPTLLLDEVETFIRENEGMRGVLNSGFTRDSAVVIRTEGDNHEPTAFGTWCPKVGALIGKLPDTLQDRAIVVLLRRRLNSEQAERFCRRNHAEMFDLRAKAARWAGDNLEALRELDPAMPDDLGDRAQDAWRPLYAVALRAGGVWPALSREASLAFSGTQEEDGGGGPLLLTHVREVFNKRYSASIGSQELCDALNKNEEWPWGEWRHGKPITTRGIANILKKYGIRPKQESAGSFYAAKFFQDAWQRYLPPPNATSATEANSVNKTNSLRQSESASSSAIRQTAWQIDDDPEVIDYASVLADVALARPDEQKPLLNGHGVDDGEDF
jgi:putative DNA primase/helicase